MAVLCKLELCIGKQYFSLMPRVLLYRLLYMEVLEFLSYFPLIVRVSKHCKKLERRCNRIVFFFYIIVALGVHCDTYKSSYKIS
jgi:hypothetical protein